jgi:hypothetical protein
MELAKLALTQKPSIFEYEPLNKEALESEITEFETKIIQLMEFEAKFLEKRDEERGN